METTGHLGHRSRLREKYKKGGISGFLDYEILELLLSYSIKRQDVKETARNLLAKFGSLGGVMHASVDELTSVRGIGDFSGIFLNLIGEIGDLINRESVTNNDMTSIVGKKSLLTYLYSHISFRSQEHFMVIYLDSANRVVEEKIMFQGTLDKSAIYPRDILEHIFRLNAKSVIFAHNHPTGVCTPSSKDIEMTMSIKQSLLQFDVFLLDHIIVGRNTHFSFLENGLL